MNVLRKFQLLLFLISLFFIGVNLFFYFQFDGFNRSTALIFKTHVETNAKLREVMTELNDIKFRMSAYVAKIFPVAVSNYRLKGSVKVIDSYWASYLEAIYQHDEEEGQYFDVIQRVNKGFIEFRKFEKRLQEAYDQDNRTMVKSLLLNDWAIIHSTLRLELEALLNQHRDHENEFFHENLSKNRRNILIGLAILGIVIFLALVISRIFSLLFLNFNSQLQNQHRASKANSLFNLGSGFAHEINNPLSIILGATVKVKRELLSHGEIDEKMNVYLEKIKKSSSKIASIVQSFKLLSGPDIENEEIHEIVNLKNLLQQVLIFLGYQFDKVGVKIASSFDDVIVYQCKPSLIAQVCVSILTNAKEAAMNSEQSQVRMALRKVGGNAIISIYDSGPGIPDELRDKIFDPFFTTKEETTSVGLGLSNAHSLIRTIRGAELSLGPCKGGETCFIITIPIERENY